LHNKIYQPIRGDFILRTINQQLLSDKNLPSPISIRLFITWHKYWEERFVPKTWVFLATPEQMPSNLEACEACFVAYNKASTFYRSSIAFQWHNPVDFDSGSN